MQDIKKAMISTLFVVCIVVAFFIWDISINPKNTDARLRDTLAGTIDCLIIGASQAQFGIYTRDVDAGLACNSYNLAYSAYSTQEKDFLLREELERNDVETIIFELSYDTMKHGKKIKYTRGNTYTVLRMGSIKDRVEYFLKYVNLDNKLLVASQWMFEGLKERCVGIEPPTENEINLKGTYFMQVRNYRLQDSEIVDAYNSDVFSVDAFNSETIKRTADLISLCRQNCDRVYVVVIPVSDNYIWSTEGLDDFKDWANTYCDDLKVPLFDFNLLRNRYDLFNDEDCYSSDMHHMSEKGAKIFTQELTSIIKKYDNGIDVSDDFFSSYDELKASSPYMKAYSELTTIE